MTAVPSCCFLFSKFLLRLQPVSLILLDPRPSLPPTFDDCVHFGFVYGYGAVFNEVSKVFNSYGGEVAFGQFAVPFVFV